jgi:hypothetical protein
LPASVTALGEGALSGCFALVRVKAPAHLVGAVKAACPAAEVVAI